MSQHRKTELARLRAVWRSAQPGSSVKRTHEHSAPPSETPPRPENVAAAAPGTRKDKVEPTAVSAPQPPRAPRERPSPSAPLPKLSERSQRPPRRRKAKKRIYLNVVLSADLERRLEKALAHFRTIHGEAFGRSAYGRRALLSQLERDGF
jgi:hypothetical protein